MSAAVLVQDAYLVMSPSRLAMVDDDAGERLIESVEWYRSKGGRCSRPNGSREVVS
jgi:hypothetical protein